MAHPDQLYCCSCHARSGYEDIGESGLPYCDNCRLVDKAAEVLNETPELFVAALAELVSPFRALADGVVENLICEAAEAAARGDLEQARHKLRLAAKPKWSSESECQSAYEKAMAEKRGVAA